MNEEQVDTILAYWFNTDAAGSSKNPPPTPSEQWNSSLWFFGGEQVDAYILEHFAPLMAPVAHALQDDTSEFRHNMSTKTKVATIILLDQFTRNAYRGSSKMFQYDDLASSLAKIVINDRNVPFITIPWNYRLFVLICLTHMEDEYSVNQSAIGLSALASELSQDTITYAPVMVTRIKRVFKNTENHLSIIKR
jgi:uncharacterized protein (DUF924 family)